MMQVHVSHPTEFFKVVEPAYNRLIQTGDDTTTLDIALAPGQYDGEHFKVIDRQNSGHVAVRVHAADPLHPPVLTNLTINLSGRSLHLENLVIADSTATNSVVTLRARDEIVVSNCAFVGLKRSPWPPDGSLATIEPAFGGTAARLLMHDCWWLGNCQGGTGYLLDLSGQQTSWASVNFERVVFLDNQFDLGIRLGALQSVAFEKCLLHAVTTLTQVEYVGTRLQVCNSVLIGKPCIDDLVDFDASARITPGVLLELNPDVPPRFTLMDNQQFDADILEQLDLPKLVQQARRGVISDIKALVAKLSG
ncbi:MAG: hypothetical protein AAF810_23440 [Cyanobacteria bacterium P01_D01_bin.36]